MAPIEVTSVNLKQIVKSGWPDADRDFVVEKTTIDLDNVDLKGGVAVKTLFVSVDPYQRSRLSGVRTYVDPYVPGQTIDSDAVVRVIKSASDKYPVGTIIVGYFRWQTYSVVPGKIIHGKMFNAVPTQYNLPPSIWVGAGGMPGRTAHYGLLLSDPKPGETLYVSAASGAVGQIVGGLALARGLKVIGSAGTDDKVRYLVDELGFDPASFNYKTTRTRDGLKKWLAGLGRRGLDIYFDNVGGEMLDDAIYCSADFGRIICCGAVAQYNAASPSDIYRLKYASLFITRRLQMKGFVVSDDHENRLKEFYDEVPALLASGKLKYRETKTSGLENAPQTMIDMLKGKNFGKAVVVVATDEE